MKQRTLIGICAVIVGVILYFIAQWGLKQKDLYDQAKQIAQAREAEVTYRKNAQGEAVARAVAAETSLRALRETLPDMERELKRDFDVKLRHVQSYLKAQIESHAIGAGSSRDTTIFTVVGLDTTRQTGYAVHAREPHFSLDGYATSTTFQYSRHSWDTLTFVSHFERPKRLLGIPVGRQQLYIDGKSVDPTAMLVGLTNYQIKDYRPKRLGIGPYAGYDGHASFGLALSYHLIEF